MIFGKGKQPAMMPRLKVRTARVCVQCETLFSGYGACPSCGSGEAVPLSRWITPMDQMKKVVRRPVTRGVA